MVVWPSMIFGLFKSAKLDFASTKTKTLETTETPKDLLKCRYSQQGIPSPLLCSSVHMTPNPPTLALDIVEALQMIVLPRYELFASQSIPYELVLQKYDAYGNP